jgi:hypothetical protein
MIVAEQPNSSRSVVVSPPETWSPSLTLAQALLSETSAPWLQPTTLGRLAGSHDAESRLARKSPPSIKYSSRELSGGYLDQVKALNSSLSLYKSVLYPPAPGYTQGLEEAVAATESSAWRRGAASAANGQALVTGNSAYLTKAQGRVRILHSAEITMAGSSGVLPVTIRSTLGHSVQVKLSVAPAVGPDGAAPLKVGQLDNVIRIGANQTVLVKLHLSSAPIGTTNIKLRLTDLQGRELPDSGQQLNVHSTRYGQDILLLIAGAIGLLVLASLFRAGRRWLGTAGTGAGTAGTGAGTAGTGADSGAGGVDPGMGGAHPGPPGNVMEGRKDPTEAPDDLADARRWADDS